ncbi:unnamed protein product, partial [Staurois parvus]
QAEWHRWGHCWALLGTGGGTAGHRWAGLGRTAGRNLRVSLLGTDHQGTDHQCPDDRGDMCTDHQGTDDQCALMICVAPAVPPVSVHQC